MDVTAAHPGLTRSRFCWQLRSRTLALGERTLLMGIVNVTPDSFSAAHRFPAAHQAVEQALRLLDEGADIVDLGGESTRPGATPLCAEDERTRVLPVIRGVLSARPDAVLSVDTYHAATAQAALALGAEIVNDVSGLLWDAEMAPTLAQHPGGAILMHTRGKPGEWKSLPPLPHRDVVPLVLNGFRHSLALAAKAGVETSRIVLDPGFGFGKLGDENFVLLAHWRELQQMNLPLLAGISRKRFLTAHLITPTDEDRREATIAANVAAILGGAHLLRVHEVRAGYTAARVADAILDAAQSP
jgi:dihydropteroate synthase